MKNLSHLDAEGREHRVARVGEAVAEGTAAVLAVGVLELHAVDRRRNHTRLRIFFLIT